MCLVVLWKYGFKLIKFVVKIILIDKEFLISWNKVNFCEYGFYFNVNLNVDYLCWFQVFEWIIGGGLFVCCKEMLMFNGYEDEVVSFYEGMDLVKFY